MNLRIVNRHRMRHRQIKDSASLPLTCMSRESRCLCICLNVPLDIEMNTASMHHACALATWRSHNAACSHSSAHVGSSKATLTIQAVAWAMRINEVSSRRLIIFLICLLLLRAVLSIPGYSGLFSILSSICAVGPLWVSGRITQKLTRVGGRRVGPSSAGAQRRKSHPPPRPSVEGSVS